MCLTVWDVKWDVEGKGKFVMEGSDQQLWGMNAS